MQGIFVAASKQHVGKTSVSLSIMQKLKQKFNHVGFLKPVGQQHVVEQGIKVDKDVKLFKEYFNLSKCDYKYMSPIIVDKNYTRNFLDNEFKYINQTNTVQNAYDEIIKKNDFVLVEGTGHTGVGSVIDLNNARVANLLGLDMLLVANGGIGKTIDYLELNRTMCQHENVNVRGVIVNKVIPEKVNEVSFYVQKYLDKHQIPLLGVVPFLEGIDSPKMIDLQTLLNSPILSKNKQPNFHVKDINLVEITLTHFLREIKSKMIKNTLFVTHSSRNDIILGFCSYAAIYKGQFGKLWDNGLIICNDGYLEPSMEDMIKKCQAAIISTPKSTSDIILKINQSTAKFNAEDPIRTELAIQHYNNFIDIDKLFY